MINCSECGELPPDADQNGFVSYRVDFSELSSRTQKRGGNRHERYCTHCSAASPRYDVQEFETKSPYAYCKKCIAHGWGLEVNEFRHDWDTGETLRKAKK